MSLSRWVVATHSFQCRAARKAWNRTRFQPNFQRSFAFVIQSVVSVLRLYETDSIRAPSNGTLTLFQLC